MSVKPQKTAVIYARVSSKEQEKEGYSIPAQLKLLREYAQSNGFKVIQEYIDIETAKRSGRANFNKMVAYIKEERTGRKPNAPRSAILVEKTDRLYRNIKDWTIIDVDDMDVEIHFVKENTILSSKSRSSEKFIHGIKVLMAKNYIDNLSEEASKGMREKAEQGIFPTRAPLGYLNAEENGRRVIKLDPQTAPVVAKLYDWYSTGDYSVPQLVDMAYEEGLKFRKSGSKINRSTLYRILTNPLYYGDFEWNGKYYHGIHEPIVSKETWDTVQTVLSGKSRNRIRQTKKEWAFQGLLLCGYCGCAITAEIKKDKYSYYHCSHYKAKCPGKYTREEELDRQFSDIVKDIVIAESLHQWLVSALRESHEDERKYHEKAIRDLNQQAERMQKRLEGLYIDKLDGKIDEGFYNDKSRQWRSEQSEVYRKIEKHMDANRSYMEDGIMILELSQKAHEFYEEQDLLEKRELLNYILSNSYLKDGKVIPKYRKPFDLLASAKDICEDKIAGNEPQIAQNEDWHAWQESNLRPTA